MTSFSRLKFAFCALLMALLASHASASTSAPETNNPSLPSSSSFFSEIKDFFSHMIHWATCSKGTCPVETKKEEDHEWKAFQEEEKTVLNEESDI